MADVDRYEHQLRSHTRRWQLIGAAIVVGLIGIRLYFWYERRQEIDAMRPAVRIEIDIDASGRAKLYECPDAMTLEQCVETAASSADVHHIDKDRRDADIYYAPAAKSRVHEVVELVEHHGFEAREHESNDIPTSP
jgi:hypothetical protein